MLFIISKFIKFKKNTLLFKKLYFYKIKIINTFAFN